MASQLHIEELSPIDFTWERYESNYGDRLNLDFRSSIDNKVMAREIKRRCVGWCDGGKLTIRPKSDMVALMLEDDEFEGYPGITREGCRKYLDERILSDEYLAVELRES